MELQEKQIAKPQAGRSVAEPLPALSLNAYRHKRSLFIATLVLQMVLLLSIAVPKAWTMAHGTSVTFDTVSVDPWNPFMGEYVTLKYDFSSVKKFDKKLGVGDKVFVVLRKDGKGKWQAERAVTEMPKLARGQKVLKGKVKYLWPDRGATLEYGIEQVYLQEGLGKNVESGKNLKVDVTIDDSGSPVITEMRSDGNTIFKWHWL